MKSLIVISFAFLGWAFYLLSDGADFQPPVAPVAAETQIANAPDERATPAARTAAQAEDGVVQATALVARPAITRPATASASTDPAGSANDAQLLAKPAFLTPADTTGMSGENTGQAVALDQVRTSLGQGLALFPDAAPTPEIELASLAQGATGLNQTAADTAQEPAEPAAVEVPPADLREVIGTRVNMRDGPGTIYPVIARLSIGRKVEVLEKSGTGWLKLRTIPDRQIGWIAASLISKATN